MSVANILIVEDDKDIREGVRILLESEGYGVTEAEDGIAGLRLLSDETDLVILDVMMPGSPGYGLVKRYRSGRTEESFSLGQQGFNLEPGLLSETERQSGRRKRKAPKLVFGT